MRKNNNLIDGLWTLVLILLMICCLSSCNGRNEIKASNGKVTEISALSSVDKFKYRVRVEYIYPFTDSYSQNQTEVFYFWTNKSYRVGDTITIQ